MKRMTSIGVREASPGFVLLAVLIFVLLLSMVVVSLLFRSRGEETAAEAGARSEQSWSAAMSGVQAAIRIAMTAGSGAMEWQDSPAQFRDRLVYDDGADQWFFTVYSPAGSGETVEIHFGLSDEASRVNLNHPGAADLSRIPRLTAPLAQAIRQYMGADSKSDSGPTGGAADDGGVSGFSSVGPGDSFLRLTGLDGGLDGSATMTFPSSHRGPLLTLDDILEVPGFNWSLLHGEDANLNGHLDSNEDDGDEHFPPDNHDGILDRGMAQYLTVSSWDPDRTATGRLRVDLNDPHDPLPSTNFPSGFTNFVEALRMSKQKLRHPADLLGAVITVKNQLGETSTVASGILPEHLPWVLDGFTTDGDLRHDGQINVNTASAAVLSTLPGIDVALAETIVSARAGLSAERRATVAWLLLEGLVQPELFKALAPQLTARAYQFGFSVLGYGLPSGRFCVLQVIVDTATRPPHITYLRDLTRLGLPFQPSADKAAEPAGPSRGRSAHLDLGWGRREGIIRG